MKDDLMVDSCEGWHWEDEDRLVGAKDGADALELLEVGVIVASFVGAVFALKAVASAVGLEVVVDRALEGIAEVLRLLELVDRMVGEAVGAMVDAAVDGDDGCGGFRVVEVVGVVVVVADAVSAVGTAVASLTVVGDSGDGSEVGTSVDALDEDVAVAVVVAVAETVEMDVGMKDDLMVDSCEGWHWEDEDRLVGAKDGADALELLEVGVIVASFVGAVFALKAVASAVGLEVVVDRALEGIAEVLRLLELVDRMVGEAVGAMVDAAVDGDDGCGGFRVVEVVGVVVVVADAVSAVGTAVASLTVVGDSGDGSEVGTSVELLVSCVGFSVDSIVGA